MYNYPIDVLKKKLLKRNTPPTVFDSDTGFFVTYEKEKKSKVKAVLTYTLLLVIAGFVFNYIVLSPVMDTRDNVNAVKAVTDGSLSIENQRALKEIRSMGTVVYENKNGNLVSILISLDKNTVEPALKEAMKLSNLKEVSTDRRTISLVLVTD